MKSLIYILTLFFSVMFFAGCGHNGFIYQNADVWNVGYNQNTQQIGIQRFNGELLTAGSRENTAITADFYEETSNNNNDFNTRNSRIKTIKFSTGIQINGYTVALANSNPEFAVQFLNELRKIGKNTRYFAVKDNKLFEIDEEEYEKESLEKIKIDGENQLVE